MPNLMRTAEAFLASKLFTTCGEDISVTPHGGVTSTITALVEPETLVDDQSQNQQAYERNVTVCRDDSLGYGAVEPQIGMVVTAQGMEYSISAFSLSNPTFAVLTCRRSTQAQVTRPGFRGNGTRRS